MTDTATHNPNSLNIGDPQAGMRTTHGEAKKNLRGRSRGPAQKIGRTLSHMEQQSTAPRLAEFIEAVVIEMGGPQRCAREWVAEFRASKPGSHQRTKMLDQLTKMMGIYGEMTGEHGSADEMSDEELMAVLEAGEGEIDFGDDDGEGDE